MFLATNVSYIAIFGVPDRSKSYEIGFVGSFVSVVMSLASIMTGLLLTVRLREFDEKGINVAVCDMSS